jgi:hypothetical protein
MAPGVWKLFEWFKNNQDRAKNRPDGGVLRYAINSNLVPKDDLMNKLIDLSQYVPHLEVYTSNECVGAHAEYIRDGLKYKTWRSNLVTFLEKANFRALTIMMTINSLCLFSIVEFFEDMKKLKKTTARKQQPVNTTVIMRTMLKQVSHK